MTLHTCSARNLRKAVSGIQGVLQAGGWGGGNSWQESPGREVGHGSPRPVPGKGLPPTQGELNEGARAPGTGPPPSLRALGQIGEWAFG